MNDLPDALDRLHRRVDFLNNQLTDEQAENVRLADELGMLKRDQLTATEDTSKIPEPAELCELPGSRFACMKFQRKPESEPAGKARFFRESHYGNLWCYPHGDATNFFFGVGGKVSYPSDSSLENTLHYVKNGSRQEITEAEALAELADWPKGLAKLRELIGEER